DTFEHLLETLYEAYQEDQLAWDTKSYTTELNQTIPFNKYTISKLSTLFSDETDDQVVLAIKKADQNEVAYKLMSQVLLDQGLTINQSDYIVASTGYILYALDSNLLGLNFFTSQLYPLDHYSELDSLIGKNESSYFDYLTFDDRFILSFDKIEGQLLFISIQHQADYLAPYRSLIWSYFALCSISLIAFLVFSLTGLKFRYDDERLYEKHKDELPQNVLILDVGGLGQIRMANPKFYELTGLKQVKMLDDVTKDKISIREQLKSQKSIFLGIETKEGLIDYLFVVVKKKRGYLLIGENVENVTSFEGKYRNLALFNQLTHLPNEMNLKEILDEIDRKKKYSIIYFAVEDIDNIQNTIGREYSKQFIQKLKDLFLSVVIKDGMTLFHVHDQRFAILYQNILNYDSVDSWVQVTIDKINNSVLLQDLPFKVALKAGIIHNV